MKIRWIIQAVTGVGLEKRKGLAYLLSLIQTSLFLLVAQGGFMSAKHQSLSSSYVHR